VALQPLFGGSILGRDCCYLAYSGKGGQLQRLYSMFPNGWPGIGLLILRLVVGGASLQDAIVALMGSAHHEPIVVLFIPAAAGLFLLVGLWTPIAGTIAAGGQLLIALSGTEQPRITICLFAIAACIAMLGPGNWSIDALLFGRQRIDLSGH